MITLLCFFLPMFHWILVVDAWVLAPRPRNQYRPSLTARNVVFTKLSTDSLIALQTAQEEALRLDNHEIDNPCLLLGICAHPGRVASTLQEYQIQYDKIRDTLTYLQPSKAAASIPKLADFNNDKKDLPYASSCQQTLFAAGTLSAAMGNPEIQPEHIFLALLEYKEINGEPQAATRSDDCEAMEIIYHLDATVEGEDICASLLQNLMKDEASSSASSPASSTSSSSNEQRTTAGAGVGGGLNDKDRASRRSLLAECGTDLTELAREGMLDKVHGRDEEIQACFQTLVRRRKNNVCLVGDAGVGKTSVAEGVAQILVSDDCPIFMQGYRIISLEVSSLIAGTTYRGEFEAKLRDIIEELMASRKRTILFVDEIHQMVGAGATGESNMDASNILKPYLARGELQVMGATTIAEYNKHIAKDAALERRFTPIYVREPTIEQTVGILQAVLPFYMSHHRVEFTHTALEAAARLTDRYIHDRFLPDKAIDILDEAGALATLKRIPDQPAPEVTEASITDLISQWTNIPVGKLELDEMGKLKALEEGLTRRVKGQERAVQTVSKAIRRARTGIRNPRRPIASFLFCGPTGTGKTELCKTLADTYFGSERDMIRIDCSEYLEQSAVARLIGPPPGFVGYEEGGYLTEAVRRAPHSVVLLDELEKAHPDVLNVLLQVMEDGILTDGKGRTVSFKNTVLIMTSNIGSKRILDLCKTDHKPEYSKLSKVVQVELNKKMKPEFLNRVDDIVVFEPLQKIELQLIAAMMVADIVARAQLERGLDVSVTRNLVDRMVDEGMATAGQFGARPMRRAVQRILENAISDAVVQGFLSEGNQAEFDFQDDQIVVCRGDEEELCFPLEEATRDLKLDEALLPEDGEDEMDQDGPNGSDSEYLLATN